MDQALDGAHAAASALRLALARARDELLHDALAALAPAAGQEPDAPRRHAALRATEASFDAHLSDLQGVYQCLDACESALVVAQAHATWAAGGELGGDADAGGSSWDMPLGSASARGAAPSTPGGGGSGGEEDFVRVLLGEALSQGARGGWRRGAGQESGGSPRPAWRPASPRPGLATPPSPGRRSPAAPQASRRSYAASGRSASQPASARHRAARSPRARQHPAAGSAVGGGGGGGSSATLGASLSARLTLAAKAAEHSLRQLLQTLDRALLRPLMEAAGRAPPPSPPRRALDAGGLQGLGEAAAAARAAAAVVRHAQAVAGEGQRLLQAALPHLARAVQRLPLPAAPAGGGTVAAAAATPGRSRPSSGLASMRSSAFGGAAGSAASGLQRLFPANLSSLMSEPLLPPPLSREPSDLRQEQAPPQQGHGQGVQEEEEEEDNDDESLAALLEQALGLGSAQHGGQGPGFAAAPGSAEAASAGAWQGGGGALGVAGVAGGSADPVVSLGGWSGAQHAQRGGAAAATPPLPAAGASSATTASFTAAPLQPRDLARDLLDAAAHAHTAELPPPPPPPSANGGAASPRQAPCTCTCATATRSHAPAAAATVSPRGSGDGRGAPAPLDPAWREAVCVASQLDSALCASAAAAQAASPRGAAAASRLRGEAPCAGALVAQAQALLAHTRQAGATTSPGVPALTPSAWPAQSLGTPAPARPQQQHQRHTEGSPYMMPAGGDASPLRVAAAAEGAGGRAGAAAAAICDDALSVFVTRQQVVGAAPSSAARLAALPRLLAPLPSAAAVGAEVGAGGEGRVTLLPEDVRQALLASPEEEQRPGRPPLSPPQPAGVGQGGALAGSSACGSSAGGGAAVWELERSGGGQGAPAAASPCATVPRSVGGRLLPAAGQEVLEAEESGLGGAQGVVEQQQREQQGGVGTEQSAAQGAPSSASSGVAVVVRVPVVEDLNAEFRRGLSALRAKEGENRRTLEAFLATKRELLLGEEPCLV